MTLEEAIEQLSVLLAVAQLLESADNEAATKLGIEALKAVVLERETYAFERIGLLPGETEK